MTTPPMQVQSSQPHQVYVTVAPGRRESYPSNTARLAGYSLLVAGTLLIICNIIGIPTNIGLYFVGHGFWVGIPFVATGIATVIAAKQKLPGCIIGSMVLGIISSVLLVGVLTNSSIGLTFDIHGWYGGSTNETGIALNSIMLICGVAGFILALIISISGCYGLCCSSTGYQAQQVIYIPTEHQTNQQGQQVVIIPSGQQVNSQSPHIVYIQPGQQAPVALQQASAAPSGQPPPYHLNQETGSNTMSEKPPIDKY